MHSGLRFDDEAYLQVERKPDNVIYKAPLPRSISYEKYLPSIEQQGDYGTCVAFTCAYYTRTATEAIQRGLTDRAQINQLRFSPAYLYARFKLPNDVACQQGGLMDEALTVLKKYGVPLWSTMPYPTCGGSVSPFDREAGRYRIRHFERVFDLMGSFKQIAQGQSANDVSQRNVLNVKRALAGGYPVPVAMLVPLSFVSVSTDTWTPGPNDVSDLVDEITSGFKRQRVFGHAMTVVGYDDNRQAFRVVNSWGTRWADKGLCWIKYSDFSVFTRYAFRIYPAEPSPIKTSISAKPTIIASNTRKPIHRTKPVPSSATVNPKFIKATATLQASVDMRLIDGSAMPALRQPDRDSTLTDAPNDGIGTYRLVNGYPSGTRFKLTVNNDQAAYVYAIGTDQSMQLTRLFPYADSLSAMVDANEAAVLPGPTKHIRLDHNPGQEYYLLLFSDEPLDLTALMATMSSMTGSVSEKITRTLGNRLMDRQALRYASDRIEFNTGRDVTGKVVPLLISLDHKP